MAQAPTVDSPLRVPLVTSIMSRDETGNFDGKLVNCYAEQDPTDGNFWIQKRIGFSTPLYNPGTGTGNGMYFWENAAGVGNLYFVTGNKLYKDGTLLATLTNPVIGVMFWQQVRGSTQYLVFGDGTNAYYTDGTTTTNIHSHDANFPATFVKGWAYLDGTLYVMDTTSVIHGSNIDDPTTWNPLNVITARVEADFGVCLIKHLVYVVALKRWTMEAFYDASNATGSPLGSVAGSFQPYGCVDSQSVQEIDGTHFWMTFNRTLYPQIVRMDNLQITIVSTPPVERMLAKGVSLAGPGASLINSIVLKIGGHRFYIITVGLIGITLVYDIDQKLWYQWTNAAGTGSWPIVSQSYNLSTQQLLQDLAGPIYIAGMDFTYPSDNGVVPTVDIITNNFDGGVDRIKHLPLLRINADQVKGSILNLRINDDDYQADQWTNFRQINLGNKRPILADCASFYRRALHFRHHSNTKFRIKTADFQLDKGTL